MLSKGSLYKFLVIGVFSLLTLATCGDADTSQESVGAATPNVRITLPDVMHPDVRLISEERILQQNCGGTAEVENQIERSRSIAHTIEVGGEFTVRADGRVGIPGDVASIGLGAEIAGRLGYSYGTIEEISRSITVKAREGTNMEHHIRLMEIWETGTARVMLDDREIDIPFSFRRDFAIELLDSIDIGCPTTPVPSSTLPPPTDTRSSTPTSTATTPASTQIPSPTATNGLSGPAEIQMPELCMKTSTPCQCSWSFAIVRPDSPEEMPDTKTILNTGTGMLEIYEVTNTCEAEECIIADYNRVRGPQVLPGGRTELVLNYLWKLDPGLGKNHSHTITIRSNAENCPVLTIDVPIRYQ